MSDTFTLSKDITLNLADILSLSKRIPVETVDYCNTPIAIADISLSTVAEYSQLSTIDGDFWQLPVKIDCEYNERLLEFLNGVLAGFADKFIIDQKTTTLLSTLLADFLTQPDVIQAYPSTKFSKFGRQEWKYRLLIVEFIEFLSDARIRCHSSFQQSELSKLISCFKIFILNEIVTTILSPAKMDFNHR